MTPEQINVAIAESVGWEIEEVGNAVFVIPPKNTIGTGYCDVCKDHPLIIKLIPNYHGDLNAIFGVWMTLTQLEKFSKHLDRITAREGNWIVLATAQQRCEAYLRTIGKWEESE
jgi:hypothetical protein